MSNNEANSWVSEVLWDLFVHAQQNGLILTSAALENALVMAAAETSAEHKPTSALLKRGGR